MNRNAAVLSLLCRLIIGMIFLISGLAKIADPFRFIFALRDFQLFPETTIPFLVIFLPWFEFVLGLFLILGVFTRTSALLLAGLNGMFALAIVSLIARGIEIDCGCFGLLADALHLPDMADYKAVIRNLIFCGMCVFIVRTKDTVLSLEGYFRNNTSA